MHQFLISVKNDDIDSVIRYINSRQDPKELMKIIDQKGKSALHFAAEYGTLRICELLIEKEFLINIQDNESNIPLHYAVKNGFYDIVEFLVENGSLIDTTTYVLFIY